DKDSPHSWESCRAGAGTGSARAPSSFRFRWLVLAEASTLKWSAPQAASMRDPHQLPRVRQKKSVANAPSELPFDRSRNKAFRAAGRSEKTRSDLTAGCGGRRAL